MNLLWIALALSIIANVYLFVAARFWRHELRVAMKMTAWLSEEVAREFAGDQQALVRFMLAVERVINRAEKEHGIKVKRYPLPIPNRSDNN